MKKQAVVFIHGIWANSLEMFYLNQFFRRQGYNTYGFNYPSLRRSPRQNARRLHGFVNGLEEQEVHLVAHSLGGVVTLHMFDLFEDIKPGKVVLMGCPYQGSAVARFFDSQPLLQNLVLGRAQEGALLKTAPAWDGHRPLGVLAGNQPYGMGTVMKAIEGLAHDGTVHVQETVIDTATDFTVLPVSHSSMLFDRHAAAAVEHFLSKDCFPA